MGDLRGRDEDARGKRESIVSATFSLESQSIQNMAGTHAREIAPALGEAPPLAFWRSASSPAGIRGRGGVVEVTGGGATDPADGLEATTGTAMDAAVARLGSA